MASILSIILVIVMAFSSIGGMTANLEETSSFEVKVDADVQTIMMLTGSTQGTDAEEMQKNVKLVEDILGAATLKGVADKESTELALYAGEDLLLSLGVKNTEEGAIFASSMLGSQTVSVSKETIEKMQEEAMGSVSQIVTTSSGMDILGMVDQLQNMNWEQISQDAMEAFAPLFAAVQEKTGEAESGEFTVDGLAYTAKIPLNMTYDELMELILTGAKDLLGKESVKPLVEMFAKDSDPVAELDKALENLKNQPAEEKYELTIASYADAEGGSYFACDAVRAGNEDGTIKAENIHFGAGQAGGTTKAVITSEGMNFELTSGMEDGSVSSTKVSLTGEGLAAAVDAKNMPDGSSDVTVDLTIQGMPVKFHALSAADGDRTNFQVEIFFMSTEKPMLTLTGSSGKGGEKVCVYEGEEITVSSYEDLSADESAASALSMKLVTGIMTSFTTLAKNLPEDSATAVKQMMKEMMSPGEGDITKEEAPQEEAVPAD